MNEDVILDTAELVDDQIGAVALTEVDDATEQFIDRATAGHLDELQTIIMTVDGAEAPAPETLAYAMERCDHIANLYGFETPGLAREGYAEMAVQKGGEMKDAVLRRASDVSMGVLKTVVQRFRNTYDRLAVNIRTMFKRSASYTKDANTIKQRAAAMKQSTLANSGAVYSNAVRVAHFTRGDHSVAASGREISTSMEASLSAFQAVGVFMQKFDHIFEFGAKNKGQANFDELAAAMQDSKYFPHQFSLSGPDALFGEEFLMTKVAGETTSIDQMIAIIRGIAVSHEYIWRVKDLEKPALQPRTPDEISHDIDEVMKAGQYVYEWCRTWEHTIGKYVAKAANRASTPPWQNIDFYKSPGNYLLYNQLYCNIILNLGTAIAKALTVNEKALLCLLDYYRWSLNQYK